ncbi:MAG: alpha/beta fold hydrolase [Propylenella sp.]
MGRVGRRVLWVSAAVVFVGGVAAYELFKHDMDPIRAAVAAGSEIAVTAAGPIEYAVRGEGVPLLSIHGAGGGYDQGFAVADDLVGGGFNVVAPSRFGYLRTPVPDDPSPAAQAEAHVALLDSLGIDKAIVMGASAGAPSAAEMALRHPERVLALILIAPAAYAPGHLPSLDDTFGSRMVLRAVMAGADFAWWSADRVARPMLVRFLGVPPELAAAATAVERERLDGWVDSVLPLSARLAGIRIDSTVVLERLPLESLAVPTLIVAARDDLFKTLPAAEFMAGQVPGAKLAVFDTGGHLFIGRAEEVQAAVREFLAGAGLAASVAGIERPRQSAAAAGGRQ